jgi:hypothetical protein
MGDKMSATYRAIALSGPGPFSKVSKPLLRPEQESIKCGILDQDTAAARARQSCM